MPMRLLIVDEEAAMHDAYRQSFDPQRGRLAVGQADLPRFEAVHHHQGLEAVRAVEESLTAGHPFSVAFIGMQMPSGIDGKETARRIRALDPNINLVISAGGADPSPVEIGRVAGPADKIVYLAKPFETAEIVQTAITLGERWQTGLALSDAHSRLDQQTVQLSDWTREVAAHERRARHVAGHDALTDAPNRLAFQHALEERARRPGAFAVALVDLDRFKLVNDTLGHLAGDEVIRAVCAILQDVVPVGGLVARLGGDEFGLLFDAAGAEAAVMVCDRLVAACHVPMDALGDPVQGSVSAGVVVSDTAAAIGPVDLMRRADLALNLAKRDGRNVARLFDAAMEDHIRVRRRIEQDLSHAIGRDELSMVFQPIVENCTCAVVGFEALLRWRPEGAEAISPAIFIPIAEETNVIHELGDWVLAKSLEALKEWPEQYVSVNFSPRQFRRHNFVGYVMEQVLRAGIAPQRLQIEITETAIFDDAERAADTLYRLRQMGFRVALDNFGTGYSSLYNIRKFALDSVKIDRGFIDAMVRERESAAIVNAIIYLARALGLGVIAEGVETEVQVDMLRAAGASHLQGYLFARPLSAGDACALAHHGVAAGPCLDGDFSEDMPATGTEG